MSDLRRRWILRLPQVSARGLKVFATITMVLVYASRIILEKGVIGLDSYTTDELLKAMEVTPNLTGVVGVASIVGLMAGIATPIFAFLLVEGFLHTGNFSKYLRDLTLLGVASEFVYDFAMAGTWLDLSRQNPMLGMVTALIMLYILRMLDGKQMTEKVIGSILVTLCAVFWTVIFRMEYGLETVLLAAVLYSFRKHNALKIILGIFVSLVDPLGPMAFCGIGYYNGERELKLHKYVYYVIYFAQFLVFGLVRQYML